VSRHSPRPAPIRSILVAGAALLALAGAADRATAACPGDCDEVGEVTLENVVLAVRIALGEVARGECLAADRDGDGAVSVDELVAAVDALRDACPIEPIFPANYRETYTEVRNCRPSVEHGGVSVRVLASPLAAQPYLEEQNPLPLGSVVVKEEFDGPECDDADLIRWRVMRKESPGFDSEHGDWHWQWVEADRSVLFDDKATCIGCHVRSECVARDYMCTVAGDAELLPVLQSLPAALLSVSGTGPDDVWAVGADPAADQRGPLVLHYDGGKWQRLDSRATGDLWWVSVEPIAGSFYMSGEGGLILKADAETRSITRVDTPTDALLYGVWGSAANDLWAVGGDAEDAGVVLHDDGSGFAVQDLSGVVSGGLPTLFKVWGRSASEVYAVGLRGTILRWSGSAWSQVQSNSTRPLFTVHGNQSQVFAVGGFIDGAILELVGDAFEDRTPANAPQLNGVFAPAQGLPAAAGRELSLARRTAAGWSVEQRQEGSILDFHATWVDPEGGVWAVGGDLSDLTQGRLHYAGSRIISSVIEQPPRCPTGGAGGGGTVSYAADVRPLLQQSGCLDTGCHGGAFPSSGYSVGTYESTFVQGIEARALDACPVTPGDPDASFLVEKLLPSPRLGSRMPSSRPPLSDQQIDLIRTWISEGAHDN